MNGTRLRTAVLVSLAALVTGAAVVTALSLLTRDETDPAVDVAVATATLTNDMAGLLNDIDASTGAGATGLSGAQRDQLAQGRRQADSLAKRARTDVPARSAARRTLVSATRDVRAVVSDTDAAQRGGNAALRANARIGRQRLAQVNARLQTANRRRAFAGSALTGISRAQRAAGIESVDLAYPGAAVKGATDGTLLGSDVAPAGDVNGDGRDDVITTAPGDGEAVVVLGGRVRGANELPDLGASNSFRISSLAQSDLIVDEDQTEEEARSDSNVVLRSRDLAVAGIGDIDDDGYDDVAVGAQYTDGAAGEDTGAVYVIYGARRPTDVDASALGNRGFEVAGPGPYWQVGAAVAGGEDLNGDRRPDLVLGGREHIGNQQMTAAEGLAVTWMVPGGQRRSGTVRLTRRDVPAGGWRVRGIGTDLAVSGDMNGDGIGDLIGGDAYNRMDAPGLAAIVRGRRGGSGSLSVPKRSVGVTPIKVAFGTLIGSGATALGDVNHDGLADAGLISRTPNGAASAHVIFGSRQTPDALRLDRSNPGVTDIALGRAGKDNRDWAADGLRAAGDLDSDDHNDLVVATPPAQVTGGPPGLPGTRLIAGKAVPRGGRSSTRALTAGGATVEGSGVAQSPSSEYGYGDPGVVVGAGDIDGDGAPDLAAGLPQTAVIENDADRTEYAGGLFLVPRATAAVVRGPLQGTVTPRGLGIVRVGASAGAFARRVGGSASVSRAGEGDCGYLDTSDARVAFLTDKGRISRVEISGPGYLTDTGIQVGDPDSAVQRAYPGKVRRERHEYVPGGEYLKVTDRRGGRLNFSTDRGRITSIWAGVEPDVDFVEGCA